MFLRYSGRIDPIIESILLVILLGELRPLIFGDINEQYLLIPVILYVCERDYLFPFVFMGVVNLNRLEFFSF